MTDLAVVVRVSKEFSGSFERPLASRTRRFEESCRGAYIKPWSAVCVYEFLILSLLSLSTNSRESWRGRDGEGKKEEGLKPTFFLRLLCLQRLKA